MRTKKQKKPNKKTSSKKVVQARPKTWPKRTSTRVNNPLYSGFKKSLTLDWLSLSLNLKNQPSLTKKLKSKRPIAGPLGFLSKNAESPKPETLAIETPKPLLVESPAVSPEVSQVVLKEPLILFEQLKAEGHQNQLNLNDLVRPDDKLSQSIEAFLLDQRSVHTQRAYGKDLKRFIKYLIFRRATLGPESLTRMVIIGYKDHLLSEKLEHTSIDRHLSTLRSFFEWLVHDGVIQKNPAQGVKFLNPKKISSTQGFSDAEVQKVVGAPNLHTRSGSMHYAILMILFYCGLRRSEVCELRTKSIAIERELPVIKFRGKGNAERIIPMIEPVWNALQYYVKMVKRQKDFWQTDQPLFTAIKNNRTKLYDKPLNPSVIFYIVTKYAKMAGIAHRVSPHSCRATAISNARDHKVPDRAIMEFAGWSSTDMITRYDKRKTAVTESAAFSIAYGTETRPIPVVNQTKIDTLD